MTDNRIPPIGVDLQDQAGNTTVQWYRFWARLPTTQGGSTGRQTFWRTLDIYNSRGGVNIAPEQAAQGAGTGTAIRGVLRIAITSPLTVRINLDGAAIAIVTIPAATTPGSGISWPFTAVIAAGQVFSWDIVTSDNSADPNGVASITAIWAA